jgi:hypothetical protein
LGIEGQQPKPDPLAERKRLTFEQAEGAQPLPRQLHLKEVSPELRAMLWDLVFGEVSDAKRHDGSQYIVSGPWYDLLKEHHVYRLHKMADEFTNTYQVIISELKAIFSSDNYLQIFGFLQFVLRNPYCPPHFSEDIEVRLILAGAAYCVYEATIFPIGSDQELSTIKQAFADVAASEFHGARAHLRKAAEELTAGQYADSVRESIHAVESVAKILEPTADLSKALAKLERSGSIHGGMKAAFLSLYGYTSNEQGIRHALLEAGAPAVDETDALFMIGACAAFVSYMINKARKA